ncbi:hypothetical protein AUJ35_02795 [Candidatus Falkowbacteria bacterium CG1_02_41_21]|uniref:Uncharacterized protein n=1 Tax=Candidatus Falkowbacteria bacterium CG1_02_41_21 TaxID=1805147 RepID=A0A1J4T5L0_9BACT|nr:MAG: hypothetical protein AUJ35_02795 [Candidatus Falkowbacteria bacterium CG1_02_41_21]
MAVDQQLLNRGGGQNPAESGDDVMASRLMQDKNKAKAASGPDSNEEPKMNFDRYSPLAQMGSIIRREQAIQSSGTGQKDPAAASGVLAKMNDATASILKWCWQNLIFSSFSSSIIYIDIHVLGHMLWPKMFCKLGHEWIPKEMKKAAPKQAEMFGEQIGTCEKGCCCCVNGFCGLITIAVLAIMGAVVGLINSTIGETFGWISGLFD